MDTKFYFCKHCGNIIEYAENKGVAVMCCGERMSELIPNTVDAAVEKHSPVIKTEGNTVSVSIGSVNHPMLPEHFIKWVYLSTNKGAQRKELNPGDAPIVEFKLSKDEKPVAAFAYCNLHGLWKTDI